MSWLAEHVAFRRRETAERRAGGGEASLRMRSLGQARPRSLSEALRRGGTPAVLAEIKFRSPSRGELRSSRDVEVVAASYERHGASALSVLVDGTHFAGSMDHLARARAVVDLPILAKGFLLDPGDLLEARAAGADAVLLIAACLSGEELRALHGLTVELGMEALVELHGEEDLDKLQGLEPALVGVNHRNLATLGMDPDLGARMAPRLPADAVKVAESGLSCRGDLDRMAALGFDAVLVGTAFMNHPDPGAALARMLEEAP